VGVTNVSDSGAYGGLLRPGLIDGASIDAGALTSSSAEIGDFFKLLKPGVMSLVVFTAFIGLALAPGDCHGFLFFVKLLSIAMASGGAAAFNMWYDRDIDAIMKRTMKRPIPAGRICPDDALAFSVVVSSMALLLMIFSGSIVGAGWLLFSILFYCVV
jgi:protoheme IX farnesyltransferase